jgi:hypothetical protein
LQNKNVYLESRVNILLNTINAKESKILLQEKQIEKLERIIQMNHQSDSLLKAQNKNLQKENSRLQSIMRIERITFGAILMGILALSL